MKFALIFGLLCVARSGAAELSIGHEDAPGGVKIVLGTTTADVYVDAADYKVVNIAAGLLSEDVERVTSKKPRVINSAAQLGSNAIIVGTIDHSQVVDQLIESRKIDVSDIRGQWESFKLQMIDHPLPNVQSALVIVGSDRRATAYGIFELSRAIGVSPWYWWADVTPLHQDALVIKPATIKDGPPSVKYRGIFINDEDWGLQPWAAKTFDPQQKDIGPKTYEKVYELMLRLKMNYIWPAMHECTIEFGKIDRNISLANDWGISAGASHPEGMNRNNVDWPKLGKGEWRYDTNRENVLAFWEEWAAKRGPYDNVWTLGMRGVHDAPMLPVNADMPTKVKLLEHAISDQRDLLKKYVNPDISNVPQIFCPYKEALAQYRAGLQLPDDITIVWTEDNYGYIRQLSNPQEQGRQGGSGVYYHISYLGSPFSYVWLNTTPPALIWEEMTKAYAYGADRVWVLNVGDIKPGEVGMEFWSRLGWNINAYEREKLPQYLIDWAGGIFGKDLSGEISSVMDKYYRFGFARKPESLYRDPACFSLTNYDEAQLRLADYSQLLAKVDSISQKIPAERKDAFFELVQYPVRMAALTNEAFICTEFNKAYVKQNDMLANQYADRVEKALAQIDADTNHYNNGIQGGKWKNIITARGTTSDRWGFKWPQPVRVQNGAMNSTVETVGSKNVENVPANPSFAEKDGYISIEAEHFTRSITRGNAQWQIIPGLGRSGDTVSVYPVTVATIDKPENLASQSPSLEYDLTTAFTGEAEIIAYCLPTRSINSARGLRYAIAIDNAPPQVVDFNQATEDQRWQQNVQKDTAITQTKHNLTTSGKHTLKVWMVDPGVVIDKIVINIGGLKDSYLGPPETIAN
ncbi:MAG TPA: glycosyl hydrolase 115 family protein [Tepidisphaeraceae bacterium]|nr:glycosyl hydrolase 115 family protein [Tepidisphaeraceae bacterium]